MHRQIHKHTHTQHSTQSNIREALFFLLFLAHTNECVEHVLYAFMFVCVKERVRNFYKQNTIWSIRIALSLSETHERECVEHFLRTPVLVCERERLHKKSQHCLGKLCCSLLLTHTQTNTNTRDTRSCLCVCERDSAKKKNTNVLHFGVCVCVREKPRESAHA